MVAAYTKTAWVNHNSPAINATNLGKIETALETLHTLLANVTVNGTELRIGGVANYMAIEADGTIKMVGTATTHRDEFGDLLKTGLNNPAAHLAQDLTEGSLDFKNNCDLNDWALLTYQLNHDWVPGSVIEPHVHWWQKENKTPNWLLQYRWQRNGQEKTAAWTYRKWSANAFDYAGTTLAQISTFGEITPPDGYSISDVLQVRLLRDVAAASGQFGGVADTYTGDAEAVFLDIHIECNKLGSRTRYAD
jgi:hypothetical protein